MSCRFTVRPGRSLPQSVRITPIPPDLLCLGFVEWVTARRKAGAVEVFQSLHRVGTVTSGEIMSEWSQEYRKTVGAAEGPLSDFHRFRHTVRSELAAIHVGPETADASTGHHATESSEREVYTRINASTAFEALGRLKFPLDLPRIYQMPFDASSDTQRPMAARCKPSGVPGSPEAPDVSPGLHTPAMSRLRAPRIRRRPSAFRGAKLNSIALCPMLIHPRPGSP